MTIHTVNSTLPSHFAAMFRAERKALRRSQQWVAARVGCRRQTIIDLEAGKNVTLYTVLAALSALDKTLTITSDRPAVDNLLSLLDDPDED
jgi:HTH-type transcriptional regulator / antitoxin HipB